jgi:hypothetical protein
MKTGPASFNDTGTGRQAQRLVFRFPTASFGLPSVAMPDTVNPSGGQVGDAQQPADGIRQEDQTPPEGTPGAAQAAAKRYVAYGVTRVIVRIFRPANSWESGNLWSRLWEMKIV